MLNAHVLSCADANSIYQAAQPFPHVSFDNAFESNTLATALSCWPSSEDACWKKYSRGKRAAADPNLVGDELAKVMKFGISTEFLAWLRQLTAIDSLTADPTFFGAGLHENETGALLPIHVDFNRLGHLYRRVNVMLYLNHDWIPDWGGALELRTHLHGGDSSVTFDPIWNRLVVFESSETSWHGHPQRLACPSHRFRRSIAWYYYSADKPQQYRKRHTTIYRK